MTPWGPADWVRAATGGLWRSVNTRSGVAAWLVYFAVRSVIAWMQVFPIDWNLKTARLIAQVWMLLTPKHLDRAVAHLTAAMGDGYSSSEIRRIAEQSLESVTMFAVEAVCLPRLVNRHTWTRFIRLVNIEETLRILLSGRGAILVTGHYGSFELTGHFLAALGFDVCAVMRPLDNAYLNRFLVQSRRTHGLALLDKKGAVTRAESLVHDGAMLGFIGDQDAGRKGMFVEFFGRPASTYKSIGLLAMTAEVPIIVGYARRRGKTALYDIGVERVIQPAEWAVQDDPLRWITQTYTSAIESIARDAPEQYLWIHRRWKSLPKLRRNRVGGRHADASDRTGPLSAG